MRVRSPGMDRVRRPRADRVAQTARRQSRAASGSVSEPDGASGVAHVSLAMPVACEEDGASGAARVSLAMPVASKEDDASCAARANPTGPFASGGGGAAGKERAVAQMTTAEINGSKAIALEIRRTMSLVSPVREIPMNATGCRPDARMVLINLRT